MENPYQLDPGQAGVFQYFGEFVPAELTVTNLNADAEADYYVTSGCGEKGSTGSWSYYSTLRKGETQSVLFEWPNSYATIRNRGSYASAIVIGGDGIFRVES